MNTALITDEKEFFQTIKDQTGLDIKKGDYGFVKSDKGFVVWKKQGEDYIKKEMEYKTDILGKIIEFLNS